MRHAYVRTCVCAGVRACVRVCGCMQAWACGYMRGAHSGSCKNSHEPDASSVTHRQPGIRLILTHDNTSCLCIAFQETPVTVSSRQQQAMLSVLDIPSSVSCAREQFREAEEDVMVGQYLIPKGVGVVMNSLGMHSDPALFPHPEVDSLAHLSPDLSPLPVLRSSVHKHHAW